MTSDGARQGGGVSGALLQTLEGFAGVTLPGGMDATIRGEVVVGEGDAPWRRWTRTLPQLTLGGSLDGASEGTQADLEVRGKLGEGGMGVVYEARQHSLQRDVAIKCVRPGVGAREAVQAMLHEARYTGTLEHPNIIPVHALGLDERERPLLVMKRVEGAVWCDMIRDAGHPAWAKVKEEPLVFHLRVLTQVCNGVHFAHSRGVIHRDIKPENVMIGDYGEVYVLDWGVALDLAQVTPGGPARVVGTPAYMAPELAAGRVEAITPRTDVYLLGACLHEALTGELPHDRGSLYATLLAAAESAPRRYGPQVPEELAGICRRAMDADPAARFGSALELREAIEGFMTHRASVGLAEAARQRLGRVRALLEEPQRSDLEVQRQFSAVRFGFEQALETWPDNAQARHGLDEALEAMVGEALERRDLHQAEVLLEELGRPAPELAAACAALREAQERQEAEARRLRRYRQENDIRAFRLQRARLSAMLGAALTLGFLVIVGLHRGGIYTPGHGLHLVLLGMMVVGFGLLVGLGWSRVMGNRRSRQIITGLGTINVGALLGGVLSAVAGLEISTAFAVDYLVVAVAAAGMLPYTERYLAFVPGVFAAACFVATLAPGLYLEAGAASIFLVHLLAYILWTRDADAAPPPEA